MFAQRVPLDTETIASLDREGSRQRALEFDGGPTSQFTHTRVEGQWTRAWKRTMHSGS